MLVVGRVVLADVRVIVVVAVACWVVVVVLAVIELLDKVEDAGIERDELKVEDTGTTRDEVEGAALFRRLSKSSLYAGLPMQSAIETI